MDDNLTVQDAVVHFQDVYKRQAVRYFYYRERLPVIRQSFLH